MADDLAALEPWLVGIMARLQPGKRMALARRIGAIMRKANAKRVLANVEPDGAPMAPRRKEKPRPRKRGRASKGGTPIRERGKRGQMFRRIELARNMVVRPGAEEVALSFKPRVQTTAEIHHFGEEAPVDPRIRNSIRVRYTARRLLGFGAADREAIFAEVMAWLESKDFT